MAEILKNWEQQNKTEILIKAKQIIKNKQLKKIWGWRILFLFLGGLCFGGYYFKVSSYYSYFLYGSYFCGGILGLSLLFTVSELESYHEYNRKEEGEISSTKRRYFKQELQQTLTPDRLKIVNNIYLPCSKTYLYQIDEIIISQQNIYIIEFTDWTGVVEGMMNLEQWQNQQQEKLKNPYQDNKSNVQAVKEVVFDAVPNEEINFYNVVINLARDFNYNIPDRASYSVFDNLYEGLYWIKKQEQNSKCLLTEEEQKQIIDSLLNQHFTALEQAELNLNHNLLKKYNLYQKYK